MTINWADYRAGVREPRFLLPVAVFQCDIQYAPTHFTNERLQLVANRVREVVWGTLRGVADCPLGALRMQAGSVGPEAGSASNESEPSYFTVANETPPYDFGMQVGPSTIRFTKSRTTVEDIVVTLPILQEICEQLFADAACPGEIGQGGRPAFVDVMDIRSLIHRIKFDFKLRLRAETHITEPDVYASSREVVEKLMRLSTSPVGGGGAEERSAPLAGLQMEELLRGDVSFSFVKTVADRPRNLWVVVEAPHNVTKRDIDVLVGYRSGDGGLPLVIPDDLISWEPPLVAFYRDIVLNRLLPNVFYNIQVSPRL